jgi:SPP1 gp7 family putative phage head morphogenesis protein
MPDGSPLYEFKLAPFRISFRLPFADAIRAAEARAPRTVLPEEYYSDAMDDARRTAWTVSGLAGLGQIRDVLDSLTAAQRQGIGFSAWARDAQTQSWRLDRNRLELIFRMQAQTSYSAGHWRRFDENVDTRPFLMYSAVNDERTRPAHRAMSGYIARKDDAVWQEWTPPVGFNCRCSLLDLTTEQAQARGFPTARPDVQPDPGFERQGKPADAETAAVRYFSDQASAVTDFAVAASEFLMRMPPRLSTEVRAALPQGMYEQLESWVSSQGLARDGVAVSDAVAYQAQLRNGWHDTTLALAGGNGALAALEPCRRVDRGDAACARGRIRNAARKYLELLQTGKTLPNGQTPVEWLRERFPQFRDVEAQL